MYNDTAFWHEPRMRYCILQDENLVAVVLIFLQLLLLLLLLLLLMERQGFSQGSGPARRACRVKYAPYWSPCCSASYGYHGRR
jgi:hypothetical protein